MSEEVSEEVRVIHGDCLDVLPTLAGEPIAAVVSDPPYGLGDKWQGGTAKWPLADNGRGTTWDAGIAEGLPELIRSFPHAIIWGGQYYALPPSRGWLVWDKIVRNFSSGHCELAWTTLDQPVRAFSYSHGQLASEGKFHPTQKPLPLMAWCLKQLNLPQGSLILDPYAGSGTTGVACLKAGYRCILIEKDARYIPVIKRRLADAATPLFAEAHPR